MVLTEEKQLILALQDGSEQAFRSLVHQFQNKVLHTALGFVANLQDAEDITQLVFIEIHRSITKFREGAKLSTWIYKITTSKALEFLRYRKRKKRQHFFQSLVGLDDQLEQTMSYSFDHPGLQLEQKERAVILHQHIDQLPDNQRIAFTLQKVEGFSQKEIGAEMGLSESSVVSLLFRARKNLKNSLYTYYEGGVI